MATHSSILACSPQGRRELDMAERLSLHFSFPFKAINPHPPVCLLVWGVGAHQLFFLLSLFPLRGRSGFVVKSPPACVGGSGDVGLIPGSGRPPGGGDGSSLQYSSLESPRDGGAWWAAVRGAAQRRTRLSVHTRGGDSIVDKDVAGSHLFPLSPTSHFR